MASSTATLGNAASSDSHEGAQESCNASSPPRNYALIGMYSVVMIFWGYLDSTGSVLSAPLIAQLDATYVQYANIFIYFGIGAIMSAIISVFVLDRAESEKLGHHFIGFLIVSASIASCLMPSTFTVESQCFVWLVMGICYGALGVAFPVFVFRAWPGHASFYFFAFLIIHGVQKAAMPILIEICILHLGSYRYVLLGVSTVGILSGGLAVILPTPKHDELRSVRTIIAKENNTDGARSANDIFQELNQKQFIRNLLVALFGVILFLFRSLESGMVIFIASYTEQYLKEKYVGRYLISSYSAGQVLFRVIRACTSCSWQNESEMMVFRTLGIGYVTCFGLLVLWILSSVGYQYFVLFAVFGTSGFMLSGTYPLVHELCESITPIKGRICCIFSICCGLGDISVTLLMATIIDRHGIKNMPIALLVVCMVLIGTLLATRNIFRQYKDFQFAVMAARPQMQHKPRLSVEMNQI